MNECLCVYSNKTLFIKARTGLDLTYSCSLLNPVEIFVIVKGVHMWQSRNCS